MRIALIPFCSQQSKSSNKFLLSSDSGVKLLTYMGHRLREEGHIVRMHVPGKDVSDVWPDLPCISISWPTCNKLRRLHWDTAMLERVACQNDAVFTTHDFLSIPLRMLKPKLKIVLEAGIAPGTAFVEQDSLYPLAYSSADLVYCNNSTIQRTIPGSKVWQFSYEDTVYNLGLPRDIDVLFNVRGSSTNYSHHREFIAQMRDAGFCVRMTDPTGYLRESKEAPPEWLEGAPYDRSAYLALLQRCKVVVNLATGGGGTHSLREAIAAGCVPVTLNSQEHRDLLGDDWPYLCWYDDVKMAVMVALHNSWPKQAQAMFARLIQCSYSSAWTQARKDLQCILSGS